MKTLTIHGKIKDVQVKVVEKAPVRYEVKPMGGFRSLKGDKMHNGKTHRERFFGNDYEY